MCFGIFHGDIHHFKRAMRGTERGSTLSSAASFGVAEFTLG